MPKPDFSKEIQKVKHAGEDLQHAVDRLDTVRRRYMNQDVEITLKMNLSNFWQLKDLCDRRAMYHTGNLIGHQLYLQDYPPSLDDFELANPRIES